MRTVFFTTAYTRKPQFQLQTIAKLNKGKLLFGKYPTSEQSIDFLNAIRDNYRMLSTLEDGEIHFSTILNLESNDDHLEFEYIQGLSLEKLLLEATLSNDQILQVQIVEKLEKILKKLSTTSTNSHVHTNYKKVFGTQLFEVFSNSTCVHPGLLDCNFDNLIMESNRLSIIDYEWCFEHCLPYDYLLGRALMWFSLRHSELLKMNSQKLNLLAVSDDLLFSEAVYDKYSRVIQLIPEISKIEWFGLQKWISGNTYKRTIRLYKKPRKYSIKSVYSLDILQQRTAQIQQLTRELENDRTELQAIKQSKAYKTALRISRYKGRATRMLPTSRKKHL